jgi:hypothetical protein
MCKNIIKIFLFIFLSIFIVFSDPGKVLLVIGSDTAIWDGMSTSRYHCTYNPALYTARNENAYAVMNMDFRNRLRDSYGTPMKLTWWMMAGNIFRYATNTNVPITNTMTMYLMKKYHGEVANQVGDELSLHYHTFHWSDYNNDGLWYWNQAKTFNECRNDFDFTLSQFLLEEEIFPVSFRSGWHYMDNDWQAYLNDILPYSMHNAYPSKKTEDTEPLDNVIDWSQAPPQFIPYHPAENNYQIPGNTAGWNLRSAHLNTVQWKHLMDTVFAAAAQGQDQVACFWGHLPENDFVDNLEIMDSLAHKMEDKYEEVKFRYCTAIEAMQRWQNATDSTAPEVEITEEISGDKVYFNITSNEPLFQPQPYVAIKNIYREYKKLECTSTGTNSWQTVEGIDLDEIVKMGVAVCDSLGNQTMEIKNYLPDDEYIDNGDDNFHTITGTWNEYTKKPWQTWGKNSLIANLSNNEYASAAWLPDIKQNVRYNILFRTPPFSDPVDSLIFLVKNGVSEDTITCQSESGSDTWKFLTTKKFNKGEENVIKVIGFGPGKIAADAIRVTPLVKDYHISTNKKVLNLGEVSIDDSTDFELELNNNGVKAIEISRVTSENGYISYNNETPGVIPPMEKVTLNLKFFANKIGEVKDTIHVFNNDPKNPRFSIPVLANVQNYFKIVDDTDSTTYHEVGEWFTSNAQAYGPSSRCVYLSSNEPTYATYNTKLAYAGVYDILEIVPGTVNAANKAVYILSIENVVIDSTIVNQNQGSGAWVNIWRQYIPAGVDVEIKVLDDGKSTEGAVLRADAIKFDLVKAITDINNSKGTPRKFKLKQNYPNPFNAKTTIEYVLPEPGKVKLIIFNSLGQKVTELIDQYQTDGHYRIDWNSSNYPSGLYLYQLVSDRYTRTKKMLLVK